MDSRYHRQELVIGKLAQQRIRRAHVAIVGLGALGSAVSEILARAGVGKLTLIDRDTVEMSNLSRQLLYCEADVGLSKADAAQKRLHALNSSIDIISHNADVSHLTISSLVGKPTLIMDCTDNLYTRFLLNDYAKKHRIPWVYCGVISMEGSVFAIMPNGPCLRCFMKDTIGLPTCETSGVIASASLLVASYASHRALTILSKRPIDSTLLHFNLASSRLDSFTVNKNPSCPACLGQYSYLLGQREIRGLTQQCSGVYQYAVPELDFSALKDRLRKTKGARIAKDAAFINDLSIFSSGRIIVRAKDKKTALSLLCKYLGI